MKISQSSVDIHKNALYAIAVNSIQIVAAVVLAALLVIEKNNLAIDIFSIVIAVVVTAGAALDIREAMAARRKSDEADLDGNAVTSELFKDNSVTVINFWFSGCAPCIGELGELNTLNETLKLRGGAVIGVNTDTLGGDKRMINEAKKLLEKKGAAYQNIYVPEDSEAGVLAYSIMAFPTTVVVDRNGRLVGEPILGSINNEAQMKALQALIDEALAKDMMTLDKDMMMKPDGN